MFVLYHKCKNMESIVILFFCCYHYAYLWYMNQSCNYDDMVQMASAYQILIHQEHQ